MIAPAAGILDTAWEACEAVIDLAKGGDLRDMPWARAELLTLAARMQAKIETITADLADEEEQP